MSEWVERLAERVATSSESECWPWLGTFNSDGYGVIVSKRRQYRAHRLMFEELRGPIPEGLVIDHLCRNRACVNPAHMEPVSPSENVRRGVSPWMVNQRKEACKHGHPFTPENTEIHHGRRNCRECRRIRQRKAA